MSAGARSKVASHQAICDGIYSLGDVMSCYVFDESGNVRGENHGSITTTDELRSKYPVIVGTVWGALKNIEEVGGAMSSMEISFQNFKVVGFPIPKTKVGVIVAMQADRPAMPVIYRALGYAVGRM